MTRHLTEPSGTTIFSVDIVGVACSIHAAPTITFAAWHATAWSIGALRHLSEDHLLRVTDERTRTSTGFGRFAPRPAAGLLLSSPDDVAAELLFLFRARRYQHLLLLS